MQEKRIWTDGALATAPAAGAALVTLAGVAGTNFRCYGFWFSKEEAILNGFQLRDGAAIIRTIYLGAGEDNFYWEALNLILSGTAGSAMSINVILAGAAGMDYQAGILWE